MSIDDDRVMSFDEWCLLNSFSRSTGQRIMASDDGPSFIRLSPRRIGLTVAENRRWAQSKAARAGTIDPSEAQEATATLASISERLASIEKMLEQIFKAVRP